MHRNDVERVIEGRPGPPLHGQEAKNAGDRADADRLHRLHVSRRGRDRNKPGNRPRRRADNTWLPTDPPAHADPGERCSRRGGVGNGEGVDRNLPAATNWLHKAAAHGHLAALHQLGVMATKGQGMPTNYAAAWKAPIISNGC